MLKKYVCIPRSFLVINVYNQGKILCSPCIMDYLGTFRLILIPFWHSIYNWLRTDIQSIIDSILTFSLLLTPYWQTVWRNKTYNAQNWQGRVHKTARINPTTIYPQVTNLFDLRILEENRAVSLRKGLWAGRSQISNSRKGECFLSPSQPPEGL